MRNKKVKRKRTWFYEDLLSLTLVKNHYVFIYLKIYTVEKNNCIGVFGIINVLCLHY